MCQKNFKCNVVFCTDAIIAPRMTTSLKYEHGESIHVKHDGKWNIFEDEKEKDEEDCLTHTNKTCPIEDEFSKTFSLRTSFKDLHSKNIIGL